MLNTYLTQTQALLQNPPAPTSLYSTANLTTWINLARSQLAGEAECIRYYATVTTTPSVQVIPFSSISTGVSAANGIQGIFNIKQASVQSGPGANYLRNHSFQWFNQYYLMLPVPNSTVPNNWAQYGQGVSGSIYVYPIPDAGYTLNLDCVCYPIPLVDDTTVEAIPYPWTDCVPFFAAFYAYMSAQRQADADLFYKRYQEYVGRARSMSNSSVLQQNYSQSQDPTLGNKIGVAPASGGG